MDIRTKLVLALVGTALLSMAMLGYLNYRLSIDLYLQNSSRQLAAIAAAKSEDISGAVDDWHDAVADIAAAADPVTAARRTPNQRERAAAIWLNVYAADGTRVDRLGSGGSGYASAVADADVIELLGLERRSDGKAAAVFRAPRDSGAITIGVAVDKLNAIAANRTGLGKTGRTAIVAPSWRDELGKLNSGFMIVAGPDESRAMATGSLEAMPEVLQAAMSADSIDRTDAWWNDTASVFHASRIAGTNWRIVLSVDRAEIVTGVDQVLSQLRTLGWSLGAIVIVIGVLFGMYLARPIRQLAETLDRVRHGELELRAEVKGEDEVALLARSLNEFMDQLHHSNDLFQLGQLRVLVVDQRAPERRRLTELLTNWRMRPMTVTDAVAANAAVDAAIRDGEPIQLTLLAPATIGDNEAVVDWVTELQALHRHPIIVLSEDINALDTAALQRRGISSVLPAPLIPSHLMEAILDEMGVSAATLEAAPDVFLKQTQPRTILLAEDSPIIQRVMLSFLERWGHNVTLVENGKAASDAVQKANFDLVLMDLEMPEMDGLDATRVIRGNERGNDMRVPIIALTARATAADREACMAAGMDEYVPKPVDPKELYLLINKYPTAANADVTAATPETAKVPTNQDPVPDANATSTRLDDSAPPVVDWAAARSLTENDDALLGELVDLFPQESARHLDAIRSGLDSDDLDVVERAGHSLKSAAQMFGATAVAQIASNIEAWGKDGQGEAVREALALLETQVERLAKALRQGPAD